MEYIDSQTHLQLDRHHTCFCSSFRDLEFGEKREEAKTKTENAKKQNTPREKMATPPTKSAQKGLQTKHRNSKKQALFAQQQIIFYGSITCNVVCHIIISSTISNSN